MECSVVQPHGAISASDCESKSNVLRKLLKRANSYEDAMMPFPGATIISQLLKSNMAKNGGGGGGGERGERGERGGDGGFPGSGLSSGGSEAPQEDACSNSSQDSPQECLSPFGRPPGLGAFDLERLNDEHLRAKRARVENIIRGMSHSPSVVVPASTRHHPDGGRDRDRDMDVERDMEMDGPQQAPSPRGGGGIIGVGGGEMCSLGSPSRDHH